MEIIDLFLLSMIMLLIYTYVNQKKKESFVVNQYNRKKRSSQDTKPNGYDSSNELCYMNDTNKINDSYCRMSNKNALDISLENEKEIKECIKQNNIDFIQSSKNNLVEFTNGKKHLGPVKNFHQCFNNDNFKSNELGWRNWWIKNKTKNNVNPIKNTNKFMENYLNNLEHLKNIYI